jgi:hypothetical protein
MLCKETSETSSTNAVPQLLRLRHVFPDTKSDTTVPRSSNHCACLRRNEAQHEKVCFSSMGQKMLPRPRMFAWLAVVGKSCTPHTFDQRILPLWYLGSWYSPFRLFK